MMPLRWGRMSIAVVTAVAAFAIGQHLMPLFLGHGSIGSYGAAPAQALAFHAAEITTGPGDYMAYYRRALSYQQLGQLNLALDDLNTAVRLSPQVKSAAELGPAAANTRLPSTVALNRVVLMHRARASVLEQMNRPAEALMDLDRAVALDGRRMDALYDRGTLRSVVGRYDEAIADFDQLLARRTQLSWVLGRGVAKFFNGEFVGAADDFREASRRAPGDREIEIWLTRASQKAGLPEPVTTHDTTGQ